jgi:hypothetical protein
MGVGINVVLVVMTLCWARRIVKYLAPLRTGGIVGYGFEGVTNEIDDL